MEQEPQEGTVDHYWWLVGGKAWAQWSEHLRTSARELQP